MSVAPLSTTEGHNLCPVCAHTIAPEELRCTVCGWNVVPTDGIAGSPVRTNELWILVGAFASVYAAVFAIVAATQ